MPSHLKNLKENAANHIQQKYGIAVKPDLVREGVIKEESGMIESDLEDLYFHSSIKDGFCSLFLFQGIYFDDINKDEQILLETALNLCQSVIDKKIYFQKSQKLSIIDAGTGGLSTVFFFTVLEREISNAERCGYPLILFSIKIAELENFFSREDKINYDKLPMESLNSLILKACRKSDIVARIETANFVFLVTSIPLDKAQIAQDRICDFIKEGLKKNLPANTKEFIIEKNICQFDPTKHRSIEELLASVT